MIIRVYGPTGEVLHDCTEQGCEVSWDGYELATGQPVEGREEIPAGVEVIRGEGQYSAAIDSRKGAQDG